MVTQYDVELFQRIEQLIGKKLEQHPTEQAEVMQMLERVTEAQRMAINEMKTINESKRGGQERGGASRSKRGKRK
jgi:ATP-dependent RNA helicase DDX47/RRP3